ncbi:high affinity cgmp-specific 3 -cyclic phosphodiesterase 9a-like protein [Lasius niger]|uniref:High affinity cgmp-specific 3-cyclic phosphodiesterase 9a-like protein n=1 Tax=Lasius niger TaxID=67767 RepID=A0A0J7KGY7_LASNI|nr:high affinity cgmp-specific 3 -cyclic phosphodiesterase 9a-like protein [Lasius niger]
MDHEARNGTGSNDNEEYTNIYFIVGDRTETATYRANQVTDMELKGVFNLSADPTESQREEEGIFAKPAVH